MKLRLPPKGRIGEMPECLDDRTARHVQTACDPQALQDAAPCVRIGIAPRAANPEPAILRPDRPDDLGAGSNEIVERQRTAADQTRPIADLDLDRLPGVNREPAFRADLAESLVPECSVAPGPISIEPASSASIVTPG